MVSLYKQSRQACRYRKRKEQKAKRVQDNVERNAYFNIKNLLKRILSEKTLQEIAIKTGFQERNRELTPMALVGILMLGCSNGCDDVPIASLDTMCLYLRKWFDINVKKQSLQKKINRKETSMFIKEVMMKVMSHEIDKMLSKLLQSRRKKIHIFTRILIQDSSTISLPETMSRIFKGCGGAASKAAVKFDYIIDQVNHLIVTMKCISGKVSDAALSGNIIDHVRENDVIIRDLGYFNLSNFSKIVSKNAYFLSRLSNGVNVYLNKTDEQPVALIKHLEKLDVKRKSIDIDVYVGRIERLFIRLIGVKVPQEVVELRRQQYKKARGRSQEPSKSLHEWHGYTLMMTNIPRNKLSLKSILKLYKIRWQIELFFKNMKSILVVDKMTGKNKHRILCLIYVRLAVTWVASILYAYAQARIEEGKEVSRFKFTRWLKDMGNLKEALCTGDFTKLLDQLDRDLDLLCKAIKKPVRLKIKKNLKNRRVTKKKRKIYHENEIPYAIKFMMLWKCDFLKLTRMPLRGINMWQSGVTNNRCTR